MMDYLFSPELNPLPAGSAEATTEPARRVDLDQTTAHLTALIARIPARLAEPWTYRADNIGRPHEACYGLMSAAGGVIPGIHIEIQSSLRQGRADHQRVNPYQLGVTLAAFVAAANPATLAALIAENERLRAENRRLREGRSSEAANWA